MDPSWKTVRLHFNSLEPALWGSIQDGGVCVPSPGQGLRGGQYLGEQVTKYTSMFGQMTPAPGSGGRHGPQKAGSPYIGRPLSSETFTF